MEFYNLDSKAIAKEDASYNEGKKELSLKQELQELLQLAQINQVVEKILYDVLLYDMRGETRLYAGTAWTAAVRNKLRELGLVATIAKEGLLVVSWENRTPELMSNINDCLRCKGLTQEELDMCYEELVEGFKEAAKNNSREATVQFPRYGTPERNWDLVQKQLVYRFKEEGLRIKISRHTRDGDSPETFVFPVTWED